MDDLVAPNLTVRMIAGQQLLRWVREGKKLDPNIVPAQLSDNNISLVAGWLAFFEEAKPEGFPAEGYRNTVKNAKGLNLKPDEYSTLLMRALTSRAKWGIEERPVVLDILKSFDAPRLRRAVVGGMGFHPHPDFVDPLLKVLKECPADDTHLRHAARIALRNCLRDDERAWPTDVRNAEPIYTEIALAIPTRQAAAYLF